MTTNYSSDIAFSPAVKAIQAQKDSREGYARMEEKGGWRTAISADLVAFIAERDSFYMATASAAGQPSMQHRGGPRGFLRVQDEHTLAFADFTGNRQYISVGNLSENDRVALFLIDYANRRRIKIWGRARVVLDDGDLLQQLSDPEYQTTVEAAIVITVEAWDTNCSKHITQRYTDDQIVDQVGPLQARIAELEAELATQRSA
ncbi:MAG: pyridoxamine 5'-phosphate oxidase family protein [Alphaproteobacteria bacterium]|nr:pyridoxamine 5'-phosphate oxidase family protein [Alphaproteobacteria bacterium]